MKLHKSNKTLKGGPRSSPSSSKVVGDYSNYKQAQEGKEGKGKGIVPLYILFQVEQVPPHLQEYHYYFWCYLTFTQANSTLLHKRKRIVT